MHYVNIIIRFLYNLCFIGCIAIKTPDLEKLLKEQGQFFLSLTNISACLQLFLCHGCLMQLVQHFIKCNFNIFKTSFIPANLTLSIAADGGHFK